MTPTEKLDDGDMDRSGEAGYSGCQILLRD